MGFKRYIILIGFLLLAYIFYTIDLEKLISIILKANIILLASTLILCVINLSLKAFKWKTVIKAAGYEYEFRKSFAGWATGFFISIFTPARIGDFSRSLYLSKDKKIPLGEAFSTVLIERLIDVAILLFLGFVSVLAFAIIFGKEIISLQMLLGIIVIFVIGLAVFMRKKYVKIILKPFFNIVVPAQYKEKMQLNFSAFYDSVKKLQKKKIMLVKATIIGFICWFISIIFAYIIFLSLNLDIPIYYCLVIVPILGLVDLIPISVSGFGTREAAAIFLVSVYSISPENAVAFSLLYYFFGYIPAAITGFYFLIKRPINFKKFEVEG
ncbi:MAG: hypothetical protein COT15_03780 [Candidatus Diapherotrites archaeon CG08_land_8_20_14_0_20_34_12]|nr:MAG: hypothetical protein COT15_03780 [Candidatus Diapherotrites archaeon CG08_land_8_20_14_0_20_34_12]